MQSATRLAQPKGSSSWHCHFTITISFSTQNKSQNNPHKQYLSEVKRTNARFALGNPSKVHRRKNKIGSFTKYDYLILYLHLWTKSCTQCIQWCVLLCTTMYTSSCTREALMDRAPICPNGPPGPYRANRGMLGAKRRGLWM